MAFGLQRLTVLLLATTSCVLAVPLYGQCGGTGYSGSTQCDSGSVCTVVNQWYHQCLPGTGGGPSTTVQPTTTPRPTTTSQPVTTIPTTASTTNTAPNTISTIPAGSLVTLSNFGSNPSNVGVQVYKPSSVKANPGLLVALHGCGGNGQQYYSGTGFKGLADQRGFIVLYGSAKGNTNCWDVTSTASLTHNSGGDSLGLANAVRYAIANWGVDSNKVFVTGTSSGAMMTNVLAGVYPDLFKGGAVFAGVALGCLTTSAPTNPPDPCANGQKIQSADVWGARVRQAYSGYSGPYPKMQIWHGTADPILQYNNFQEELKQWTNVHGLSITPAQTLSNTPKSGWTKTVYGNGQVQGFSGQGSGHGLPESGTESTAIDFFGL